MTPEQSLISSVKNILLNFDCRTQTTENAAECAAMLAEEVEDYLKAQCKIGEPCSLCDHRLSLEFDRGFDAGSRAGSNPIPALAKEDDRSHG